MFGQNFQKNDQSHLTQYLAAFTASLTFFTSGLYQGWSGASLVKILSDEYPIPVNQEEASYIATIGTLGHVVGGFLFSFLADHIGRKAAIMSIGIPHILSPALICLSDYSKYLLYIARIVGGVGEGGSIAIVSIYIAEIAGPKVRGTLGGYTTAFIGTGTLMINISGSFLSLKSTAILMMIPPLIFWALFMHMPESPYYYLMKNKTEEAKESLKILRRKFDVDKEFDQLVLDVQKQMEEKGSFRDLFCNDLNRKILIIVTLLRIFQLFTGYCAFTFYSQIMIAQTTNLSPVLGSSLLIFGGLIMMVAGTFYIDKIGRRPLFLVSMFLAFLSLISMAIFLTIRDYTTINVSSILYLPLIFIVFYYIVFCGGLGIGVNIFIAEIYPANIKAKGMAIASIVFAATVTSTTKIYQYTADYIGAAVPFYIFTAMSLIGIIYVYFFVPETKGKTLGMIQDELRGKSKTEIDFTSNKY
ncbi:facilitated trehalose transporter Tret1-like [Rhynchophorus ferrugineus]|uniref:facilitated trehalose transporter Tret1-like n=1 Tax=Rhynchophorus ferrugineus TaxID=354439 RepID=UPI003FCD1D2B